MSLNVYLFFDGNCREVFEFYRSVFGGEFAIIQTFGDGPPGLNVRKPRRTGSCTCRSPSARPC